MRPAFRIAEVIVALTLPASALAGSVLERYQTPSTAGVPGEVDPFRWEFQPVVLHAGSTARAILRLVVPSGTHVYRDQLDVTVKQAGALSFGAIDLPPGLLRPNPVDGTDTRELYDLDVLIEVPITAPADLSGVVPVAVEVRHQGCREGLCYPPRTELLSIPVRVVGRGDND